ncbi:conserved hypothetical protein [Stutzerimonas stutzeri DSM 4166]|nr:conserved hypothetical protein [Stutzerimonas stutzeri DSM 4166]
MGDRLRQDARRDLPRHPPLVPAPAAYVLLSAFCDHGVPQAVRFGLVVGRHLERERLVVLDSRPAVQPHARDAHHRELGRQDVALMTRWGGRQGIPVADAQRFRVADVLPWHVTRPPRSGRETAISMTPASTRFPLRKSPRRLAQKRCDMARSPVIACAATSASWRRAAHTGWAFAIASTAASITGPCSAPRRYRPRRR